MPKTMQHDQLSERLAVALTIAENEATPLDTSNLRSELARYGFQKLEQQWAYVRDVLRAVQAERNKE